MKKNLIALAVLLAAALTSCVKEKSFNNLKPIGENGLAFTIDGGAATRSAEGVAKIERGMTIPMGSEQDGTLYFLQETIEDLNAFSPATKGAPAYTSNVGTVYSTMGVYAEAGNFGGDATFEVMDEFENPNGGKGWRYHHNYNGNPWPENKNEKVDFYLRMPADYPSVGNLNYETQGSIAFDYSSPQYGSAMKDIVFAYTSITRKEHDSYLPKGAPVMMHHALTGIKFRSDSDNSGKTKTIITKVEFIGLKGTGHCVITPGSTVEWSNLGSSTYSFSQTFDNPAYSEEADKENTVNYNAADKKFGDSWYAAGNDANNPANTRNLNDEDGSLTFWFIPQTIGEGVKMKVTFRVKTPDTPYGTPIDGDPNNATEITHTIDLGTVNNGIVWKAGQLRTYTLNPKDIDVEIFDTMDGFVKNNLHVTNTGNTPEYVRMLVIGNWYGWKPGTTAAQMKTTEPSILVGYKYAGNEDPSEIEEGDNIDTMQIPWDRWNTDYGEFDDLFAGGELAEGREDWVRATTAYYYTQPIGPGQELPESTPLFDSYTLNSENIPVIYLPSTDSDIRKPAEGVHLIMEVVVQAIGVPKNEDGTDMDWLNAWRQATKINIVPKN